MADKIYRTREAYEQRKQDIVKAKEDLRKILRSKADVQTPAGGTWFDEETEMNILKKEASWIKADDFGGIGDID